MDKEKQVNSDNLEEFLKELNKMLDEFSEPVVEPNKELFKPTAEDLEESVFYEQVNKINEQILQERKEQTKHLESLTEEEQIKYEMEQAKEVNEVADALGQTSVVFGPKKGV